MAGSTQPFRASATVTVSVAGAAAGASLPGGGDSLLVFNPNADIAFIAFGMGAVTADVTGIPIPPGGTRLLGITPYVNAVSAVISATGDGSGEVYFSRGEGSVY